MRESYHQKNTMRVESTKISGVFIVTPKVFEDSRGFFFESYNEKKYREIGIRARFVQDNHSNSVAGVVRGLHFQKEFPQGKLIRVLQGEVFDVVVDIRLGSPTFGKWISLHLTADNKKQVWIPPGFAHGFSVLSETAEFAYKVTDYYNPEDEAGIRFDDPTLSIDWKVDQPLVSEKDKALPDWETAKAHFPNL